MTLSVVIITCNEEANIGRTLASVQALVSDGKGEVIVVDSGSTDRTVEIAKSYGAKVFLEEWKGFAAQKNSAIEKATGDWILSLDADEELGNAAQLFIADFLFGSFASKLPGFDGGVRIRRRNYFLGRWLRRAGMYPDPKVRLIRRGSGHFEPRLVHEDIKLKPGKSTFDPSLHYGAHGNDIYLLHHAYPVLVGFVEHLNRYSSLGAEMAVAEGHGRFSVLNIVVRPLARFVYDYFFRFGFLDGREGLLWHLYHSAYVSLKYAKAWELAHSKEKLARVNEQTRARQAE
jgi:glycosyltransferase involved in cell wall biosynthesis